LKSNVLGLYESAVEVCNLKVLIYRHQRNYPAQANCYGLMQSLCHSIMQETGRIFALYYRVVFYAKSIPELHKKEYIYKTSGNNRIAEFQGRLKGYFGNKFGETNISFLSNTKPIIESDLLPTHVYLQVIDVKPFFPKNDVENRTTQYHQNFNVSQFIFESPFTKEKDGKMYTEDPSKQWKRKTILNTDKSAFPFVTSRLEVVPSLKLEEELSPVQVGIELIQGKMVLLQNELSFTPIDKKTLAIQLHGTLLTQVNAGPIAIAQIFLNPSVQGVTKDHQQTIKKYFKNI